MERIFMPVWQSEYTRTARDRKKSHRNAPRRGAFAAVLTLALLASVSPMALAQQAPAAPAPASEKTPSSADYRIGTGDTLSIEVFNKPELARTVTVPSGGKVSYPYIGELKVEGLTLAEMGHEIERGLSKELYTPQVTVSLTARRQLSVSILGPVQKQGKFNLGDGWRVLDLLAECGGLTVARPEWVQIKIQRGTQDILINPVLLLKSGDRNENQLLQGGDTLIVSELDSAKIRVQIYGAVVKPGAIPVPADGSVIAAINDAGGLAPRARLADAVIRRGDKSIPVNLSGLAPNATGAQLAAVSGLRLQPGDSLNIPFNGLSYSVVGSVASAGVREYPESSTPLTVMAALLQAGGATGDADLKNAKLVRLGQDGVTPVFTPINLEDAMKQAESGKNSSKSAVATIKPGDVLYIPSHKPGAKQFGFQEALSMLSLVRLFR